MATQRAGRWTNWAGNQTCAPAEVVHPTTEAELSDVVKRADEAGRTVRVVGAGHSFTDVVCTDGVLVVLDRYADILGIDQVTHLVTVQAGITLGALNDALADLGMALPNLGDIAYQSISGAISTSTHGTGAALGGLATQVVGLSLVTADGSVIRADADHEPEVFHCARVSLGALGILSTVTLQAVPRFNLRAVEEPMRLDAVLDDLDGFFDANDHAEFYWVPHTRWALTKRNNRTDDPVGGRTGVQTFVNQTLLENVAFGAMVKASKRSVWLGRKIAKLTPSAAGSSTYVDRSDKVFTSPRHVRFVEMEYALPREALRHCLDALVAWHERSGLQVSFPVEVRVAGADDIPLSTANGRDSAYVAVHMAKGVPHEQWFRAAEAIFDEVGGRPHWGKLHYQKAATLAARYPEWDRFQTLRRTLDPEGRFANDYVTRVLGP